MGEGNLANDIQCRYFVTLAEAAKRSESESNTLNGEMWTRRGSFKDRQENETGINMTR